ncbi:UNVERIFIED_CONTAM: hypothetical protein GTU68_001383 [Idotea baltica]|nr:hypothetical protein [Idotea baltica]
MTPEDFYKPAHQEIFKAMFDLSDKSEPIDIITLSEELKKRGSLDEIGGINYISSLASVVASASNVGFYATTVKDLSIRRKVIHEASSLVTEAFKTEGDISDFLDEMEQKILGVSESRSKNSFSKIGDLVQDSIKNIENMYDRKEDITGVPSGFTDLDKMTSGLQDSDLIIMAARPSMGKTSLAMTIVQWVGIHKQLPCAFFSLEMSKEQLILRTLCSEARVNNSKVRTGNLGERDFPKLVDAASKVSEAAIYIDDTPALSVTEMRAKARRLHREVGLKLIVVDYLQLMKSPTYAKNREQEISDISRSLKAIAKELQVPVIALSQLNRSLESRNDKRPLMSDLRESGAIEQDADIIMFIYRDEVYNPESADKGIAELIISKHRSGPTGNIRVAFTPQYTRFDNLEERDDIEGDYQVPEEVTSFDGDIF